MDSVERGIRKFFEDRPKLKYWARPAVRGGRKLAQPGRYIHQVLRQFYQKIQAFRNKGACEKYYQSGRGIGRSPASNRTVVMLAIADLQFDPRIEREARALAAAGYKVTILFPETAGWQEAHVDWGRGVDFHPILDHAGNFAYEFPGYYGEFFFQEATRYKPFAFHAHDLSTAYIGIAAARKTGAYLVCDFHEWYSENVTYNAQKKAYEAHSREQKDVFRWLEGEVLLHASAVITVCDTIADAMAEELGEGRRPTVVRNIPNLAARPTRVYPPLKAQFNLQDDQFVVLYQGGIGPARLLEPIIEALGVATNCTLIIRGPSIEYFETEYRKLAASVGAAERLILAPPVPSRDVVEAAKGADAGIYSVIGVGLNFTYALPNKLFEYMAAGLPVLAAQYPEARKLVQSHDIGLTFDPYDPQSIAAAINRMIDEPELRARFSANTRSALATIDAEREWHRLVEIYDKLANGTKLA